MIVLGINQVPLAWGYYHDSAAALVRDGEIVAFAEEERFNRIRHTRYFPKNAMDFCLKEGGISLEQVDAIAISLNPYFIFKYPKLWLRLHPIRFLHDLVNVLTMELFKWRMTRPILCIDHHLAHAASAYYCSGFENAIALTLDSSGERESVAVFLPQGHLLKRYLEIPLTTPFSNKKSQSVGRVYSYTSKILGMGFGRRRKNHGDLLAMVSRLTISLIFFISSLLENGS
jgi:carbamoyltransferase